MFTRRDFLPLLLLLAAISILLSPVLFSGRTFFLRDITYLFHPWKTLCSEIIQKGEIPLWNPYAYCGMPLMANWQSAVFYPFSLLFYFLPFSLAMKFFHFTHLFLGGLFAYLFGIKILKNRGGAAAMMLVFTLNGFIVSRLEFLSYCGTDIWMFALLLLFRNPVMLALTLGMAFFAGHQVFFLEAGMLFLYLLLYVPLNEKPVMGRNLIISFILAAFFGALQLLPTMELSSLSMRAKSGLDFITSNTNALKPSDILRLITPLFPSSFQPMAGEKYFWAASIHIGIIGSIAVILGLVSRVKGSLRLYSFLLLSIGILLSIGDNLPFYKYIYNHISVMRFFRYPSQYMFFSIIGLTVLSGIGFAALKHKITSRIMLAVLAIELLTLSYGFHISAPANFFLKTSDTARFLQQNLRGHRFILSPGTEKDRHMKGKSITDSWQSARGYLYNLTCMPYHINNAYGTSEPLTLEPIEQLINKAYSQNSAQASMKYFNDLDVKYLLCKTKLNDSTGYKLAEQTPLFIYELELPASLMESETILQSPHKIVLNISSAFESDFVWKETCYPGWEIYSGGRKLKISGHDGLFRQWRVEKGQSAVYQIFRPSSFYYGIIITLISLIALTIFGIIRVSSSNGLCKDSCGHLSFPQGSGGNLGFRSERRIRPRIVQ